METVISIQNYSEKAIAVFGETKPIKDHLLNIGGKFNPSLKGENDTKRAGWIFPKSKVAEVRKILEDYKNDSLPEIKQKPENQDSVIPKILKPSASSTSSSNFSFSKEQYLALVSRIERLETDLANCKKLMDKHIPSKSEINFIDSDDEDEEEETVEVVPSKSLLFKKK